jgi:membrane-bound serine protease (ClpP class)
MVDARVVGRAAQVRRAFNRHACHPAGLVPNRGGFRLFPATALAMMNTSPRSTRVWRILAGMLLVLSGVVALRLPAAHAQDTDAPVYVIQVHGPIDLGLAPYLSRVLGEAERVGARAVILDIDTPGGRLDAVLQMRDAILDSNVRTIAFVNRTAFSAGALIAISAEEIYMTPAAVMGAATPVDAGGEAADEKVVSAVRSTFRATAEERGRDPRIAEAMVDPNVEIEGLSAPGQLLTLTTTEAQRWGYANGVAPDRATLLSAAGLAGAPVVETSPRLAENVVRFLTNPIVASLLISIGVLLILIDFFTAGFGLAGTVGLVLLGTFFWGHYIAGLAGWEGLALVLLGLALIALEVFVIPGFGVAGVLGLAALLGGLFISMIGGQIVTQQALIRAGSTLALALITIVAGAVALFWLLPRLPWLRGLILQTNLALPEGVGGRRTLVLAGTLDRDDLRNGARLAVEQPALFGAAGEALTDLRPGGFAQIGGRRVDVVTRGEYITAGEPIEVVADEGYRRVVRRRGQNAATTDADRSGVR